MPPNRKKLLVSLDHETASAVELLAGTTGVTESAWAYHAIRARALGVKFAPAPRPVGFAAASPESRESATIEFGSSVVYDCTYYTIEIAYIRPETPEEESQRKQEQAVRDEQRRLHAMRVIAELDAKKRGETDAT